MEKPSLLLLFICLVPLFTALVGTIIEAVSLQDSVTVREKRIKRLLMYYFLSFIVIGSGVSTGLALPEVSVYLWPLTVFSLNIAPVLYYRFVVILTDTGHKEKCYFSFHYIYPFLLGVLCTFLYLYLPADAVLGLFRSVPVMQFILTLIYMILALRILAACFRKNKGINQELWGKWLRLSCMLVVLSVIWSGAFFLTILPRTGIWMLTIAAAAAWLQAMYLCSFTFNRRSLLFLPLIISPVPLRMPSVEQPPQNVEGRNKKYVRWNRAGDPVQVEKARLSKKLFEKHVVKKKMYLNPKLRLTDLMEVFETNRSYLSRFINDTYGCGFNGYINRLRLKELKRLLQLPSNRGKTAVKLYAKAGFPDYQVYLRISKEVRGDEAESVTVSGNPDNPTKP